MHFEAVDPETLYLHQQHAQRRATSLMLIPIQERNTMSGIFPLLLEIGVFLSEYHLQVTAEVEVGRLQQAQKVDAQTASDPQHPMERSHHAPKAK